MLASMKTAKGVKLIFYTMFTEVAHFQWVAILKTA